MPSVTVGTENGVPIGIHYEDHGRSPDRTDPWVSAGWQLVGTSGAGSARQWISSDHLRPPRLRPVESADVRVPFPALITDGTLVPVEGGPHNIAWTYPEEVNAALLSFLSEGS
jgi:pimeloyl-ACP methyl ester carboxylesterase